MQDDDLLSGALLEFPAPLKDPFTVSTLNSISFSQVAFDFAVTPALIQDGLMWALGLVGGPFSAVCAARMRAGGPRSRGGPVPRRRRRHST